MSYRESLARPGAALIHQNRARGFVIKRNEPVFKVEMTLRRCLLALKPEYRVYAWRLSQSQSSFPFHQLVRSAF